MHDPTAFRNLPADGYIAGVDTLGFRVRNLGSTH